MTLRSTPWFRITKKPTFESEGQVRVLFGSDGTHQNYLMSSGPISDTFAYRFTAMTADTDPLQDGLGGEDLQEVDDENITLSLTWNITDDVTWNIRGNDRLADLTTNAPILLDQGWGPNRGTHSEGQQVYGLKQVSSAYPLLISTAAFLSFACLAPIVKAYSSLMVHVP